MNPNARRLALLSLLLAPVACGGSSSASDVPSSPGAPVEFYKPPPPAESGAASAVPVAPGVPNAPTAAAPPPHWGYAADDGPARWGDLGTAYATCKTGTKQTPVDLPAGAARDAALAPLAPAYAPSPLVILNNGHTVQAEHRAPSTLAVGADKYKLVQFHVHAPSEHTVDKKRFDAEIHFVHKNDAGELAVVGVLFRRGKDNKALAPFIEHAPAKATPVAEEVPSVTIDVAPLVPAKARYFTYAGSLTTPPCSEGVRWFVLAEPQEISATQLAKLVGALPGENARPVQPLGDRRVSQYRP